MTWALIYFPQPGRPPSIIPVPSATVANATRGGWVVLADDRDVVDGRVSQKDGA